MTTIITGFKTIQDVEKTLEWIEKNTEYKWGGGERPTEYTAWKKYFEEYQEFGGFVITYENRIMFGNMDFYKGHYLSLEPIPFTTLINQEETFTTGEEVYTSNKSDKDAAERKNKRIYLCTVAGNYLCVSNGDEEKYNNGEEFDTTYWEHIVKIPKEDKPQEMTIQEAQELFGKMGKKIKIITPTTPCEK